MSQSPLFPIIRNEFVLIAGPCVIEDDNGEVLRTVARHLKACSQNIGLPIIFKSSYDKANRSSVSAYRGPGLAKGLDMLKAIRDEFDMPILTDVHSPEEATAAGAVVDMIQIPAFLCRQTDILLAAGETGKPVNIKKGQFLSPKEVINCADKVKSTGNHQVYITERGTTFGYNNLVVDMRSIPIVENAGLPLIFDATHSVQHPGGAGTASSGDRQFVPTLARSAVAAGCSGLFMEVHPNPSSAPSDGANMIPLEWVEPLLQSCLEIRAVLQKVPVTA